MKGKVKEEPFRLKRIVISLWIASSSLLMWYFSLSIKQEINPLQFLNFIIVLFGSGFTYHVTHYLIRYSYNKKNRKKWFEILRRLIIIDIGYLIAVIGIVVGKNINAEYGKLIASISLGVGILISWRFSIYLAFDLKKIIKFQ